MYYVKRSDSGILVKNQLKEYIVNTGLKSYLNSLCMENLSTYDGRKKAAINLLKQKSNIPIYVNNDIFVYPTKALREFDMLFINYFEVLSFKSIDKVNTLIIFNNLEEIVVNMSAKKMIKQHQRIEIIIKYFRNII